WIMFGISMSARQATTDGNVETFELIVFNNGNQCKIIGEYIHIVVGWNANSNLEFSRQVMVLIQRIVFRFFSNFFFTQPDLIICSGLWFEHLADLVCISENYSMRR